MEKQQEKSYEIITLFVIRCRNYLRSRCHMGCAGPQQRTRMIRCWSSKMTTVTVLMLVPVTTVHSTLLRCSNSTNSRTSTKVLYNCRIVESFNISFPNASFNNAVVSLGVFFKHTQNLIAQHCSPDTSIFSKYSVTHCLMIHECSASYVRFFSFFTLTAVHISSYYWCEILSILHRYLI